MKTLDKFCDCLWLSFNYGCNLFLRAQIILDPVNTKWCQIKSNHWYMWYDICGRNVVLKKRRNLNEWMIDWMNAWMNEWFIYIALYCIFLYTQSTLQSYGGGLPSTTTSVQYPLRWCDSCHRTTAPVRSPHTSYRWRGERIIETIKCMRSPHTSYRWRGERESLSQSSVCSHHTPATGGEERES